LQLDLENISKYQIKDKTLFELQELLGRHVTRKLDREILTLVREVKRLHEKYPIESEVSLIAVE